MAADARFTTFKIYYDGRSRRFTQPRYGAALSFWELEQKVRDLFDIPAYWKITISYRDGDGEYMEMDSDDELKDAYLFQRLDPLNLFVKLGVLCEGVPRRPLLAYAFFQRRCLLPYASESSAST